MAPTPTTTHPLELSEIRTRIAGFLNNKNCLSCMRVSRAWLMDFAGPVWNTLDFEKNGSFSKIPPEVVSKYGHLIRNVVKVCKEEHIMALQHPSIASLKKIEFFATHNKLSLILFHDLVGYHRQSLKTLRASGILVTTNSIEEQANSGVYLTLDAIRPACSLTTLFLDNVCISRRAFSSILRSCPSLQSLKLLSVVFLAYNPLLEHFRHAGLKTLDAARHQVWSNGEGLLPGAQSLLIHFPALETWKIRDSPVEPIEVLKKLKAAISADCPQLKKVQFSTTEADRIANYLDNGFQGLESCTFAYASLNRDVLLSLLEHQATLTSIALTPTASKIEPSTPDDVSSSKKLVGLIFKSFHRLQVLAVQSHQMDISFLEDESIACMDLVGLGVRFCGLDTPALVDGCLETLSMRQRSGVGTADSASKSGESISGRVRNQLMRFKKLKVVRLGTREYYLPTH